MSVARTEPHAGMSALNHFFEQMSTDNSAGEFVIVVPEVADAANLEESLFHWISGCDPGRDMIRSGSRIGFDATTKVPGEDDRNGIPVRDYPPILRMDDAIIERVDQRWNEYGFTGTPPISRTRRDSVPTAT